MIYKLVDSYDPILKQPTQKFDFNNPPIDPKELQDNLTETVIQLKGTGLAANQVGLPYRVAVCGHWSKPEELITLFNPNIVDLSGDLYYAEEGCLSFPGLFVKVKRNMNIRVRYQLHDGTTDTSTLDGWAARIIQHEVDHLDGITYLDRANRIHRDQAMNQKKKMDRIRRRNERRSKIA